MTCRPASLLTTVPWLVTVPTVPMPVSVPPGSTVTADVTLPKTSRVPRLMVVRPA
ncbi:Uncharacterised protein [Bordetella pertussis]|nr:Uncharacterised protein [Bordetella pertussis]